MTDANADGGNEGGDSEQVVYLASAGERYEPAYAKAVFSSREGAESWLENLDPEEPYIDSYDWSEVEEFVINGTDSDHTDAGESDGGA